MITANAFADWLSTAKAGDKIVYYFGAGFDRKHESFGRATVLRRRDMEFVMLGNKVRRDFNAGLITLVQKRVKDGYQYIAVRLRSAARPDHPLPMIEYLP